MRTSAAATQYLLFAANSDIIPCFCAPFHALFPFKLTVPFENRNRFFCSVEKCSVFFFLLVKTTLDTTHFTVFERNHVLTTSSQTKNSKVPNVNNVLELCTTV